MFRFFLSLIVFGTSIVSLLGQTSQFATRQGNVQPYAFYDWNGQLLQRLPLGSNPVLAKSDGFVLNGSVSRSTWPRYDKCDTIAVRTPDGWQLLNREGQVVKDFGQQYSKLSPAESGYFLAWEPDSVRRGTNWLHYLHTDGTPAFPGQRYWEATPFSEGYALEQKERKGLWQVINDQGEVQADLPADISPYLTLREPFHDGLAFVRAYVPVGYDRRKKALRYLFINTQGEIAIDVGELIPAVKQGNGRIMPFQGGVAGVSYRCGKYFCLAYFDPEGRILQSFAQAEAYSDWHQGTLFVKYQDATNTRSQFYNTQGQPLPWPDALHPAVTYVRSTGDYFIFQEPAIGETSKRYLVYDPVAESVALRGLAQVPFYTRAERLFFADTYDLALDSVLNLQGEMIYQPSPAERMYETLAEALPSAAEVAYLDLAGYREDDQDLSLLSRFPNLRYLRLYDYDFTELPAAVSQFEALDMLSISNCEKLTQLPNSLRQLSQLRELHISDCRQVRQLEPIIEGLPKLRRVYTSNYDFAEGFEERMAKERPTLTIDAWHSMGGMDDVIEEAPPPPKPVPPPPPRGGGHR